MTADRTRETDLYQPIKDLLEAQGYEVKGEIGALDLMACRSDEPPVIVELKTGFSLSLLHQAIDRQALTDAVYVAIPLKRGRVFARALRRNLGLCRRLGLGLITVGPAGAEVHADPAPFQPRKAPARRDRLLREFARRHGDPNTGGTVRRGLMTAYRQDALRCVHVLDHQGATKAADVARLSGVSAARRLMADNHYGWFRWVSRGIYALSATGLAAAETHAEDIAALTGVRADPHARQCDPP